MANLRFLKKEIDYRLEELVFDCDNIGTSGQICIVHGGYLLGIINIEQLEATLRTLREKLRTHCAVQHDYLSSK